MTERLRPSSRLVREGDYVAEVPVTLIETDHEWSPYLSGEDARKLDVVRVALRNGDIAAAAKLARIYELNPVAAD